MLKSLFFRQKSGNDEILPPPPPFPSMNFKDDSENAPDAQLNDWLGDVLQPTGKAKQKPSKKLSKKELKRLAKIRAKEAKSLKKQMKIKSKPNEFYDLDADFGLEQPKFQDLEDFEDLKAQNIKPKEIEEAEDEIADAIEGIKKHEKPFFSRLFGKKPAQEQEVIPEIRAGGLATIRKKIADARKLLMDLDISSAKHEYMDIMDIYNNLRPEEQAQIYSEIKDLYYERKNAEKIGT